MNDSKDYQHKKATGMSGLKGCFGDLNGMKKPGEQQAPRSNNTQGKKGAKGAKSAY